MSDVVMRTHVRCGGENTRQMAVRTQVRCDGSRTKKKKLFLNLT